MFIFYGVKDVWAIAFIFSFFYPFLDWVLLGQSLHSPTEPIISISMTVGLLATDPTISLHVAYYNFISLFISYYLMGLWADTPTVPANFFINLLLRASLAHFPYLYLFWTLLANIPAVPAHFTTSYWASSAYLLLLYLFYFHGLFARFFWLPRPNYHIFTSYYFSGLLAFKLTQ